MAESGQTALQGRRVLELAGPRGEYCGKLFADMGADLIKIEPPGGGATRDLPPFAGGQAGKDRSLSFIYLNSGKRAVTLDLERAEDRRLLVGLVVGSDLVIETFEPGYLDSLGLGYQQLSRIRPSIVLTSISGFGRNGPYQNFKSNDLVASALGGAMYVTGRAEDPPVRLAATQADVMASTYAASASMIALYHASLSGRGQHVDISAEETTASVSHICGVGKWLDDGIIPVRMGTGLFASVPSGTYACSDGLIYLMVNRPAHWKALAVWINEVTGNREVLDPMFEGPSSNRLEYRDLLDLFIAELTSTMSVDEVYHQGQGRNIAFTPTNTTAAVVADKQLESRGYFRQVEHPEAGPLRVPGPPYRHSLTPWRLGGPVPRVGQHNDEVLSEVVAPVSVRTGTDGRQTDGAGPLAGIRVVEFSVGMAGPWIGRFMAYCGAEVIRVESHKRPDVVRQYVPPWAPEMGTQPQLSPWFTDWDTGKRFVALDLARTDAVELAKRLVARADVVVENYRAGVVEKLGLGYQHLVRVCPDLIMLSTSGYGDSGPCAGYATWGPNIEALSGLSSLSGFPHRQATVTQYAYPDGASAMHGLFAVMCALDYRRGSGQGQYINLSQLETMVAAIGPALMDSLAGGPEPVRLGNASPVAAPYGCYPCRGEDRWCVVCVDDEDEWLSLCGVMQRPELAHDRRFATMALRLENSAALDAEVQAWTQGLDAYDVMQRLQKASVAAGVVQNVEDLMERDRQLAARNFFEQVEHLSKGTVTATGLPLGLTGTPGRSGRAGAAVGEDNLYVFGQLLGMSSAEIDAMVATGAIERRN